MARSIRWEPADGSQAIYLTDRAAGYRVLDETVGLNSPSYRIATEQYAGVDGVTVVAVSADARELVLALMVQANDQAAFRARVAALTRAMRPKAGPGQLVVADEYGVERQLTCYYTSGLEGNEARGTKLAGRWWKAAVHLLADDPWWYGTERTVDVGLGAPTVFFPIFPLVLSPSTVQGQFTVDLSDADDASYPVWTITGPGSALTLTNDTTGRSIEINATLTSGQSMIIDTRPEELSIRRDDGTNLMGGVVGEPVLWPLIAGINEVTAALTGATSASRISGAYRPRYAGV